MLYSFQRQQGDTLAMVDVGYTEAVHSNHCVCSATNNVGRLFKDFFSVWLVVYTLWSFISRETLVCSQIIYCQQVMVTCPCLSLSLSLSLKVFDVVLNNRSLHECPFTSSHTGSLYIPFDLLTNISTFVL